MIIRGFLITLFLFQFTAKAQVPAPPNTIPFDSSLYVDKSEVANIHWLEYLHYVKKDSSDKFYKSCIPDTTLIIKFFPKGEVLNNADYIKIKEFRYFPIVGISYQQAINYCKWRSEAVNIKWAQEKIIDTSEVKVQFRLPTIEEWIKIAYAGNYSVNITDSLSWEEDSLSAILDNMGLLSDNTDENKLLLQYFDNNPIHLVENLKYKNVPTALSGKLPMIFPATTVKKNANYIYDLRGNVSEMTLTEGIAKGGNWKSTPGEIKLMDNVRYQYPSELIGFRCVCEFIERE
ncbi:hypothetical protein GCM10027429_24730 [Marivirga atlantica]|jgi:formylglycine-generating enzyme required for sulfatase activity|uniref:SUMF1/EgtB/PvdO family nonheme iron enzyme n=1 Tax=Marivirga atlantica TaxID=1548457 RepID=A0A937AH19_9BACT|nr:SUMF1/EgtB/PvdO family nonheme iron enzyme [Marivirga atlantica]MBL0766073.1 SUMF1/EgtB/PvdO family nonheme iron enzyme [Marivirga atlantica]